MLTAMLLGSSEIWSLHGHQWLAPSPSLVTATNGRSALSVSHTNPSSQGGRGATRGVPL